MKKILVLGAGFAGLWSAVGAARKLAELNAGTEIEVTMVNRTPYHNIRVRNYEADLSDVCVPLTDVLAPIGVRIAIGDVEAIDVAGRRVSIHTAEGSRVLDYDRLVLALGSELVRPPIPGLAEHGFDVDTYKAAARLDRHIAQLGEASYGQGPHEQGPHGQGRFTALVVGAGLTGLEVATELPARLAKVRAASDSEAPIRVILADRLAHVGSDMGDSARPVIEEALRSLGIEQRVAVAIERVDATGATLGSGERIDAATVIWCGGMRANPLSAGIPGTRDALGRLVVDEFMRVVGVPGVFAAGDLARATADSGHASAMSCQHGRPMGRYAGHNVVADLLGKSLLPLRFDWYTTIVDLGPWGAVYTRGWDRQVVASGPVAKATKQTINRKRIYPPRSKNREDILAAAAPVIQLPPAVGSQAPQADTAMAAAPSS
jgi:NADH:ubiquinone reductase (H+-translocating)